MEGFRFTIFNSATLTVMALTVGMALARSRTGPEARWPILYYVPVAAFALAFPYSLNLYWVSGGILAALLVRYLPWQRPARIAELAVLAYIFIRSLGLLLLW